LAAVCGSRSLPQIPADLHARTVAVNEADDTVDISCTERIAAAPSSGVADLTHIAASRRWMLHTQGATATSRATR